jgi:hypothetical protein
MIVEQAMDIMTRKDAPIQAIHSCGYYRTLS